MTFVFSHRPLEGLVFWREKKKKNLKTERKKILFK